MLFSVKTTLLEKCIVHKGIWLGGDVPLSSVTYKDGHVFWKLILQFAKSMRSTVTNITVHP